MNVVVEESKRSAEEIADNVAMMLDLFYNNSEGWYKSGTNETIREVALTLVKAGVEEEVVHDCISEIISAIKGEYGD